MLLFSSLLCDIPVTGCGAQQFIDILQYFAIFLLMYLKEREINEPFFLYLQKEKEIAK